MDLQKLQTTSREEIGPSEECVKGKSERNMEVQQENEMDEEEEEEKKTRSQPQSKVCLGVEPYLIGSQGVSVDKRWV